MENSIELPMRLVGVLSLAAAAGVGLVVGVRLLLLARRTRCFPELAIGLGLSLITVVGLPLAVLGRLPALLRTPVGDTAFVSGLAVTSCGLGLLWAFTWRVFRPDRRWARALVVAACCGAAFSCGGLVRASFQAMVLTEILPLTRPWAVAFVCLVSGSFVWTATESLLYYQGAKRRLAVGLSDVVVVNRFLLWGTTGVAMAVLTFVIAVLLVQGRAIMLDPLGLFLISTASWVGGAAWYLTFLAPAPYVAFLRRRASAEA